MERVRSLGGVAGNEILTCATAAVLTILLVVEGVTILQLGPLLVPHMFIGMMLIPPVLLKLGATGYRFARYYSNLPAYRRKGPPLLPLRLLAPVLVVATMRDWRNLRTRLAAADTARCGVLSRPNSAAIRPPCVLAPLGPALARSHTRVSPIPPIGVFASGVALLVDGHKSDTLLFFHKATFIVWGAVFGIHFLAYVSRVLRSLRADWSARRRRAVGGSGWRGTLVGTALGSGLIIALALLPTIDAWQDAVG